MTDFIRHARPALFKIFHFQVASLFETLSTTSLYTFRETRPWTNILFFHLVSIFILVYVKFIHIEIGYCT